MDLIKKMTDEDQDPQKMNDFSFPTPANYKTVGQDWRTHFWWSEKKGDVTKVEDGITEMKIWTSEIKQQCQVLLDVIHVIHWLNPLIILKNRSLA